jgi:hypothetical protein
VQEELDTTRASYEEQLGAMSEHLMAVNAQLSEALEENAVLRQAAGKPPKAAGAARWRAP